ncbi:MAG: hypothetical protein WAW17_33555 [Rhodococcus sp. (in: high G+C Gram-positive bacteria)]|uniref:hypothetical protein n=1 Tax=Rhodococcus sp. TaxID=1831 RepID=UPI003BB0C450
MLYLLAFIGLVTVAVLLWKAFGPNPVPSRRVLGPDDDPEFLWNVGKDTQKKQSDGTESGPADHAG